MNVTFIGLGKLGMPCAEATAKKGHIVNGYDKIRKYSKYITLWPNIQGALIGADIVFISVATPHHKDYDGSLPITDLPAKDFDYTQLKEAVIECNKHMNRKQKLVVISTVLPGVIREQISPLVTNTNLIYNPYLIAMGTVADDMLNPEMIIVGTENGNKDEQLEEFYQTIVENDCDIITGTWEECECIKVFYNTFISTKISLVNMIQDVAVKKGNMNVDVVTEAL
jgi:UDPglucose 6-dehydrogenase